MRCVQRSLEAGGERTEARQGQPLACPVGAAAHRPCPWVWMGLTYLLPAARTQMLLGETKYSVHLGPSLFTAAEWERAAAQRGELLLGDSNSQRQAPGVSVPRGVLSVPGT